MTTATMSITACPTCGADGEAPCVTATTGKPARSWHARRPASAADAMAAIEAAEAEAAAVAAIEARAQAHAAARQAEADASRKLRDGAAFAYRGWDCYPVSDALDCWQLKGNGAALDRFFEVTGDRWTQSDRVEGTADQVRGQIDDVMGAAPPEKVVLPDESAVIISPTTGEVYREITPVEHKQELALEAAAAAKWEEVADRKAAREQAEREFQAKRQEEARRAELEREAKREEIRGQRETNEARWARQRREFAAENRKLLRQQHKEQDAQGLQRTSLEGLALCDSCQRRYHDPGFDFCFSCKRGKGVHEHRQRLASGEVAARQAARQKIRDDYMAPARAVAAQEKAVAEAHRREVNAELNALLESCGLPLWSGEGFQKYSHNVRLGLRYNGGLREQDAPMVTSLLERAPELSPAAHLKISDHLDIMRAGLDRMDVKAGELRRQEQPAQRNQSDSRRGYTNPISAQAAGGVWTRKPPQIRACAGCRIPLTAQYAAIAGFTSLLCRLCRNKLGPGVSSVVRRACAGCGNLLREVHLHEGVCSPNCARMAGVLAEVLPPDGVAAWQAARAAGA